MYLIQQGVLVVTTAIALAADASARGSGASSAIAAWASPKGFRIWLAVDPRGRPRSNSPAAVEVDFRQFLRERGAVGTFDEHTVEVFSVSDIVQRVPHRVDRLFGASQVTLHFVLPDHTCTNFLLYFDTVESGRGHPKRYPGLVGDGDRFVEGFQRREIAVSHFDCFVDWDGDGDLDLFQGGVEPYVFCYENVGRNRLEDRGRLASGGQLFKLPCSPANRSWVTVAFYDVDGDGAPDFFPTFGDGPDAGKIIFYRNTTREHNGQLTFTRVGPLQKVSGVPLAGGAQAGGWFPSITFVSDWDGDGAGPDALVGSNHRCWLYRGLAPARQRHPLTPSLSSSGGEGVRRAGEEKHGVPVFADAVAVRAGGRDIELVNPRFDVADIDGDGDLDLFAATQPGPVHWFKNIGSRTMPVLAAGKAVAWGGKYLIGDAHSGVKVADFDGDALPDLASGRFWERADLNEPNAPRVFGGFFKNVGARTAPRLECRHRGGPFSEQFQICDAVRQNCVRAVDSDHDGKLDLLAGDTDGFVWFFCNVTPAPKQNRPSPFPGRARAVRAATVAGGPKPVTIVTQNDHILSRGEVRAQALGNPSAQFPVFATGQRLRAGTKLLSVAVAGGHARFDVCDWNGDGKPDLVVADGSGTVTLFLNHGSKSKPSLAPAERVLARGTPLQLGARASVLVCDWDNDGRLDLVLADEKGFYFSKNIGAPGAPQLAARKPILFGGKTVKYVRPNLGAFVDWDGDGQRDLIGCHFENSVRFYRNVGSGAPGEEPKFADPEGVVILQAESPQMISGADAVDWNGDGDLDLLTGQGHGGSGLRFYERDWIEDELNHAHPRVTVRRFEILGPLNK